MSAAIQARAQRRTPGPGGRAGNTRTAVVPIEIRYATQPWQELRFYTAFPSIHVYAERAGSKDLPAGIGIPEKSIAALRDHLPLADGAENQECEGDRPRLTQRALLSTEEFRMHARLSPDAPEVAICIAGAAQDFSRYSQRVEKSAPIVKQECYF